jgi:hypothetical protein
MCQLWVWKVEVPPLTGLRDLARVVGPLTARTTRKTRERVDETRRVRSCLFSHSIVSKCLAGSLLQSADWLHSEFDRQPERPAAIVRREQSFCFVRALVSCAFTHISRLCLVGISKITHSTERCPLGSAADRLVVGVDSTAFSVIQRAFSKCIQADSKWYQVSL